MSVKDDLLLDVERRDELRRGWSRLFKRFEKAHWACERSFSEANVHALRLAGRHCLPVLEVLRALRPREAVWTMAYHSIRDLLDVLGPLRDAQVRRLRLETSPHKDRAQRFLVARAIGEEKVARPSAKASLTMICAMPIQLIKGRAGKTLLHAMELEKALSATLDHRLKGLLDRWRTVSTRRPVSLHKARVALKRYRYLLVALEPCLNDEQRRTMPRLDKIQHAIGRWHDDQLFIDWLKQAGRSGAQWLKRTSSGEAAHLKQLKPFLGRTGAFT